LVSLTMALVKTRNV